MSVMVSCPNPSVLRVIWLRNRTVVNWLRPDGWLDKRKKCGKGSRKPKIPPKRRTWDDVEAALGPLVKVSLSLNVDGRPRYYRRVHGRIRWREFVSAGAENPEPAVGTPLLPAEPDLGCAPSPEKPGFWGRIKRAVGVVDAWGHTPRPVPVFENYFFNDTSSPNYHGCHCFCRLCKPDWRWAICDPHSGQCDYGCGKSVVVWQRSFSLFDPFVWTKLDCGTAECRDSRPKYSSGVLGGGPSKGSVNYGYGVEDLSSHDGEAFAFDAEIADIEGGCESSDGD